MSDIHMTPIKNEENKKGNLYFLVGLAHSGKSTFANKWKNEHRGTNYLEYNPNRVVIEGDSFRKALYGRSFQIEAEAFVFASMDIATRALLNTGYDVLIDETCTTEATLLRYLRLDENAQPIFIDTPKTECINRAVKHNKSYLVLPIVRMDKQLQSLRRNWSSVVNRLKEYLNERRIQDVAV